METYGSENRQQQALVDHKTSAELHSYSMTVVEDGGYQF